MVTLTAPGEADGLVWDRSRCQHPAGVRCGGPIGCKVVASVAREWNDSQAERWSELNRIAKQHADRAVRRLGHQYKGGALVTQLELHQRGVWHRHIVLGMETAVERVWAFEYAAKLRASGGSKWFGFVDAKPLHAPGEARRVAGYLGKYLSKWQDGEMKVSETVLTSGPRLITYVSRKLTARSGCTMRMLRLARRVWAFRQGWIDDLPVDAGELLIAIALLDRTTVPVRGP